MYIVAPVVFVIELLALLVHNLGNGEEEEKAAITSQAVYDDTETDSETDFQNDSEHKRQVEPWAERPAEAS
jgi:hypothetical protein